MEERKDGETLFHTTLSATAGLQVSTYNFCEINTNNTFFAVLIPTKQFCFLENI